MDVGELLKYLHNAVLLEAGHSICNSETPDLFGFRSLLDEIFHSLVALQHFMDSESPTVAGVVARLASNGLGKHQFLPVQTGRGELFGAVLRDNLIQLSVFRFVHPFAFLAQPPRQALGKDAEKRIGETEGVETHLQEPGNGFRGSIGVEGGQDEMSGQGRLNGNGGGFLIPHFTHHDDIRVEPQK